MINLKELKNMDFVSFSKKTRMILEEIIGNKENLEILLNEVLKKNNLIEKAEQYDFLDKIILCDEGGISVRISIFNDKYANRIHFHRWNYSSLIIKGEYIQNFYGIAPKDGDFTYLEPYIPIYIENLKQGNFCTINNNIIHSIKAEPGTISLSIRSEAKCDRFLAVDSKSYNSWWQYGSKMEAREERNMKKMNIETLEEKLEFLKKELL